MRILAIGDIHGCLRALEAMAAFVGFRDDDVIVTLGDYVDRGPDSKGAIDFMLTLQEKHEVIPLRGNHEIMMLEAAESGDTMKGWLSVGGAQTLASYGSSFADVPATHWEFIKNTKSHFETKTHFFVHANAVPDLPIRQQPPAVLYWERFGKPRRHVSGKTMVCGHTAQPSGEPKVFPHAVCIDTFAYGGGWLTCLDVTTGNLWQTNQQGQRKSGVL